MRTRPQTVWLLLSLLLAACGDSSEAESSTTYPECVEPPFVAGIDPNWAPCGCEGGPWEAACKAKEGQACYRVEFGNATCVQVGCERDEQCEPFQGIQTECYSAGCFIPCGGGCPTGMTCYRNFYGVDQCLYSTPGE